jgi:hypothetical protein
MKNAAFYAADGGTPISAVGGTLIAILGGASDTPVKFGVRSSGDEAWAVGLKARIIAVGSGGGNARLRIGLDVATLSPPWGVVVQVLDDGYGSWGATGLYFITITALNALGETVGSVEVSFTITDVGQTALYTWEPVPGATHYKGYRRPDAGTYATPSLIFDTSDEFWSDEGLSPGAGAPPAENTTAGGAPNYGTPPVMNFGPALIGALAVGQWAFFRVSRVVPGGIQSSHKFAGIKLTES